MAESTDTSRGFVENFDDFDRKVIDITNRWTTNSDTGGTAFAINDQTNGVIRGGVDTDDNDLTNLFDFVDFRLDESPATVEWRAKTVTSVANGETFIGVTDSNSTDENPITLSAADVQTSNATDAAGFAYTGGGTGNWKAVAVKTDSDLTPVACNVGGATTPIVGTWQTFKMVFSTEGHCRFFIDGREQAFIENAVSPTVLLNAGICVQGGTTARSLDVDYRYVKHGRRMTA